MRTSNGTIIFIDARGGCASSEDIGQTWKFLGFVPKYVHSQACVAVNDSLVLIIGGADEDIVPYVQAYNVQSNSWSAWPSMGPTRQRHVAVIMPDKNVLVCGGVGTFGPAFTDCFTLDTTTQRWREAKYVLDKPRSSFGMLLAQAPAHH